MPAERDLGREARRTATFSGPSTRDTGAPIRPCRCGSADRACRRAASRPAPARSPSMPPADVPCLRRLLMRISREFAEHGDDRAPGELDLERIVAQRPALGELGLGRGAECASVAGAAAQRRLGLPGAPGLVRDAAEREPHVLHRAVLDAPAPPRPRPARRRSSPGRAPCDRSSCAANGSGGSSTAVISSPGRSIGFDVGRVARQAVEVGQRQRCASPSGPRRWTTASSAASATHMSDGWVATQAREAPRIAWYAVEALERVAARAGLRACCSASRRRRRNRGSGCAAGCCRRPSPCCGSAPRRRPGSRGPAPDSAARTARWLGQRGVLHGGADHAGRRRRVSSIAAATGR